MSEGKGGDDISSTDKAFEDKASTSDEDRGSSSRRPGRRPSYDSVEMKLEKSRQSARECRARKRVRYQYLEDLVKAKERAIFALKEEQEMYKRFCKEVDSGNITEEMKAQLTESKETKVKQPPSTSPTYTTAPEGQSKEVGERKAQALPNHWHGDQFKLNPSASKNLTGSFPTQSEHKTLRKVVRSISYEEKFIHSSRSGKSGKRKSTRQGGIPNPDKTVEHEVHSTSTVTFPKMPGQVSFPGTRGRAKSVSSGADISSSKPVRKSAAATVSRAPDQYQNPDSLIEHLPHYNHEWLPSSNLTANAPYNASESISHRPFSARAGVLFPGNEYFPSVYNIQSVTTNDSYGSTHQSGHLIGGTDAASPLERNVTLQVPYQQHPTAETAFSQSHFCSTANTIPVSGTFMNQTEPGLTYQKSSIAEGPGAFVSQSQPNVAFGTSSASDSGTIMNQLQLPLNIENLTNQNTYTAALLEMDEEEIKSVYFDQN